MLAYSNIRGNLRCFISALLHYITSSRSEWGRNTNNFNFISNWSAEERLSCLRLQNTHFSALNALTAPLHFCLFWLNTSLQQGPECIFSLSLSLHAVWAILPSLHTVKYIYSNNSGQMAQAKSHHFSPRPKSALYLIFTTLYRRRKARFQAVFICNSLESSRYSRIGRKHQHEISGSASESKHLACIMYTTVYLKKEH